MPIPRRPAGGGVRERPGDDPGAADARRERGAGGVPHRVREVRRRAGAGGAEERRPARGPVPPVRRPRPSAWRWRRRRCGRSSRTSGAADAQPPRRRRPRQRRAGRPRAVRPPPRDRRRGQRREPARHGRAGGGAVLRRVRAVPPAAAGRPRVRLHDPQPPPAARPGERAPQLRYALLTKDCFSAVCTVGFDPLQGFFHAKPPRQAVARPRPDGGVPPDHRRLGGADARQQRTGRPGRLPALARGVSAHRGRAEDVLRGLRAAEGDGGDAPGVRLPDELRRMLEVQARMLAAYVRGSVPAYTGFTVR